ncbi:hypothetical protein [Burkholderia metallica]|uniref:hypothetical protein n=1 Tax=Burkholderia metallica TaxID=488729 RepID=UPI000841AFAA|nr:hypothetical protein [Burkholderia metallica]AOJ33295.1 hypothetical protein WJ16_16960 [Burkholderia metallica]
MTSRQHTGREYSRSRAHADERTRQGHDSSGHRGGHGNGPSPIDGRKALKGMGYRAGNAAADGCAERPHAAPSGLDMLRRIHAREYGTPASVSKEPGRLM